MDPPVYRPTQKAVTACMHVTQNSAARGQNSILQRVEFVRIPLYGAYYDSPMNPWGSFRCLAGNRNRNRSDGKFWPHIGKGSKG